MADLATIEWAKASERTDAESDPSGNSDIYNRANRTLYAVLSNQHNDTGATAAAIHKLGDFLVSEQGSYAGNSTDDRVFSFTKSDLTAYFVMILARGTEYPVLKTLDMAGDTTKELATNAFQANAIQDITTTGQMTLGNDATVNATGTTYDYFILGVE